MYFNLTVYLENETKYLSGPIIILKYSSNKKRTVEKKVFRDSPASNPRVYYVTCAGAHICRDC